MGKYINAIEVLDFIGMTTTTLDMTFDQIEAVITRMEARFEDSTNNVWNSGGTASPDYPLIENEVQDGKGHYNRSYYLDNYPLPVVSTTLASDLAVGAGTVQANSTSGFLSSGYLGIGGNKISYTGKSGTAFTGVSGVTEAGSAGTSVKPYVVEISVTDSGSDPTWSILSEDDEFNLDLESGRVYTYKDAIQLSVFNVSSPPKIPNRFRTTYIWGNSTVPDDVKQGILLMASKELIKRVVRKSHLSGLNDFNPKLINVDDDEIQDIINDYINYRNSNI